MSSFLKDFDPLKTFKSLPRSKKILAGAVAIVGVLGIISKIRSSQKKESAYCPNVPHYTAQKVVDCNNKLGECCIWDDRKQLLCWIDYANKEFLTFDPITKETKTYSLPEEPGSFALCEDDSYLLMCFKSGPVFYDIESGKMSKKLFDFEPNQGTRMNDGRCDRFGRFVVGGCIDVFGLNAQKLSTFFTNFRRAFFCSSSIYRINSDLSHNELIGGIKCTNSVCFSLDGHTMYYTDSFKHGIRKREYYENEKQNGTKDEVFSGEYKGAADGSCIDAKGNLWNAHCGIGKVGCFDENGNVLMVVDVPEKRVTCVAFGGADDTLFITCLDPLVVPFGGLEKNVGNLYAVKIPNVKGLKENRFKGIWRK